MMTLRWEEMLLGALLLRCNEIALGRGIMMRQYIGLSHCVGFRYFVVMIMRWEETLRWIELLRCD